MPQVIVASPLFLRPRRPALAKARHRVDAASGPARGILLAAAFSSLVWAGLASLLL